MIAAFYQRSGPLGCRSLRSTTNSLLCDRSFIPYAFDHVYGQTNEFTYGMTITASHNPAIYNGVKFLPPVDAMQMKMLQ